MKELKAKLEEKFGKKWKLVAFAGVVVIMIALNYIFSWF